MNKVCSFIPDKKGYYIGLFWGILEISQLLGNVMSLVMFHQSITYFYSLMSIFGLICQVIFLFVKNYSQKNELPLE